MDCPFLWLPPALATCDLFRMPQLGAVGSTTAYSVDMGMTTHILSHEHRSEWNGDQNISNPECAHQNNSCSPHFIARIWLESFGAAHVCKQLGKLLSCGWCNMVQPALENKTKHSEPWVQPILNHRRTRLLDWFRMTSLFTPK